MDEQKKKLLLADRMVILQAFVDYYLRLTKGKYFADLYPDEKDEYGRLNHKQEELLHDYLKLEYRTFGLDLDKRLQEKDAKVTEGNILTDFEMDELVRLADELILLNGVILERKARLYDKK